MVGMSQDPPRGAVLYSAKKPCTQPALLSMSFFEHMKFYVLKPCASTYMITNNKVCILMWDPTLKRRAELGSWRAALSAGFLPLQVHFAELIIPCWN